MYTARQGCIYLIACLLRPGAIDFATQLEEDFFTPDTDANSDYNIIQINYCSLPHYILELPCAIYPEAEALAREYNLQLVPGKPHCIGGSEFSLSCSGDMCFTLETSWVGEHAR